MSKPTKEINFKLYYEDLEDNDRKLSYWIGDRIYDLVLIIRGWFKK